MLLARLAISRSLCKPTIQVPIKNLAPRSQPFIPACRRLFSASVPAKSIINRPPPPVSSTTALADRALKDGVRLLYTAPTRVTSFRVVSWTLATCFTASAVYLTLDRLKNPQNYERTDGRFGWLFSVANVGVGFVLLGLSAVLVSRTPGIVQSIELLKESGRVHLRFDVRGMLPYKRYTIQTRPDNITLKRTVTPSLAIPEFVQWKGLNTSSASAAVLSVLQDTARVTLGSPFYLIAFAQYFIRQSGVATMQVQAEGEDQKDEVLYLDLYGPGEGALFWKLLPKPL